MATIKRKSEKEKRQQKIKGCLVAESTPESNKPIKKKMYIVFVDKPNDFLPVPKHIFTDKKDAERYSQKILNTFLVRFGKYSEEELYLMKKFGQLANCMEKYYVDDDDNYIYMNSISEDGEVTTKKTDYGCFIEDVLAD